jgi:AcrR family transcriptional regulator
VEHCIAVPTTSRLTDSLARRVAQRSVAEKQAELAGEMDRIVEATYDLVERTGNLDPSMRQILAHSGLSTQAFYRHFRSKDELMLALLDEGRRRLVVYLERRMKRVGSPEEKVRAWVEGVMAQASEPRAAARSRPFFADEDRLAEMFPDEHAASVDALVSLLNDPLSQLNNQGRRSVPETELDAQAIYRLTFATVHDHLIRRVKPREATIEHLVSFMLRAIGCRT